MRRTYAYVRVSTTEQAESGLGLEAQRERISSEGARRGWTIETIFEDAASGAKLARDGLHAALLAARGARLVVAKLDRLARSTIGAARILEWCERADVELVVLDLGIDTSTASGRLVAQVLAAVAEWERNAIGERTSAALQARKRQGRAVSRPSRLSPGLRRQIRAWRTDGWTLARICRELERRGVPTPRGGIRWRPSSLQAALDYKRPRAPLIRAGDLPALGAR